MKLCTVCKRADRAEVDAQLGAGMSCTSVAALHPPLSREAVSRHKRHHLTKVPRQRHGRAEAIIRAPRSAKAAPRSEVPAPRAMKIGASISRCGTATDRPSQRAPMDEAHVVLEAIARLELVAVDKSVEAKLRIAANAAIGRLAELHAKITGKLGPAAVFIARKPADNADPPPSSSLSDSHPPWRLVRGGKSKPRPER